MGKIDRYQNKTQQRGTVYISGTNLGMDSANERRRYYVTLLYWLRSCPEWSMYTPWDVLRSGVLYFLFDVSSQVYHWKPRYLPWCQLCRYWWYRRLLRKPTVTPGLRCHQWRQSWYHDDSLLVAMMHIFSHKWYRRLSLWQTSLVITKLASRRHSVLLYTT